MTQEWTTRLALVLALSTLPASSTPAQRARPKADEQPAVRSVVPPGVTPGRHARLVLRGRKLDSATAVRLSPDLTPVKIAERGQATPPKEIDPAQVGDTRLVVEFDLPIGSARDPIALLVVTPDGETELAPLAVDLEPPTPESEPNGGFREAQSLAVGATIDGLIEANQDVDVFRFEARGGDRIRASVFASRRGSALDPILTLYDHRGRLVATADDTGSGLDPMLEATLPASGTYYAVVADAQDKGGPLSNYRLTLSLVPAAGSPGR